MLPILIGMDVEEWWASAALLAQLAPQLLESATMEEDKSSHKGVHQGPGLI